MVSPTALARVKKARFLDENWDWRKRNSFKDDPPLQRCTTGWAYASVAAVEAIFQMRGTIQKLSVQNLIDCCLVQGGIKRNTFTSSAQTLGYIRDEGINTAAQYPTLLPPKPPQGICMRCLNKIRPKVKIKNLVVHDDMSERGLMDIVKKTPVIISIWVGKKFDEYKKEDGIGNDQVLYADRTEAEDAYRHHVLLIGFDTKKGRRDEPGEDYWIIRNSYGTAWGDKGFMKLHRNQTFKFSLAVYPVEADLIPDPPLRSQEGDVGTPVALEKKMRGTCEMASGSMATRSATRALSNKGSQDPLSSSQNDQLLQKSKKDSQTGSKGTKRRWSTFAEDPCDGKEDPHDMCLKAMKKWITKKQLEDARMEFDKWVARHGRNYGSKKEREKRLLAFTENKRRIDGSNKVEPGSWPHGYNLDSMDKFFWEN